MHFFFGWSATLLAVFSLFNGRCKASQPDSVMTLGYPANVSEEFGLFTYGAERPDSIALVRGLDFVVQCVQPDEGGFVVYGTRRNGQGVPQVCKAASADGIVFHATEVLFTLPDSVNRQLWKNSELALSGGQLTLIQCRLGTPPTAGHPMYVFQGNTDGTGWHMLQEEPLYRGQDAFSITWNADIGKLVNYQTTYQPFPKRFADNMPNIRRVLHIRTSSDAVNWNPGTSFGAEGPYLPIGDMILPDSLDSPDIEFYKMATCKLGEFWLGIMTKYVSQPPMLPKSEPLPHGPLLEFEWWISSDGLRWERPYRERSALHNIPNNLGYRLTQPFSVGSELRWLGDRTVYSISRKRMFYVYSKANAELTTNVVTLSKSPLSIDVSFESIKRKETQFLKQGYIMAELLDSEGIVIPGFEREKCIITPSSVSRVALTWGNGQLPHTMSGTKVRVKLLFRDVKLYSLTY